MVSWRGLVLGSWPLWAACTAAADKSDDTDVADTDVADTDIADTDVDTDVPDTDVVEDTDDTDVVQGEVNPCGAATPAITVGTGVSGYVAVVDGSDLAMTKGAQGGWHLWVSISAQNSPQYVSIEHSATRLSDSTLLSPLVRENNVLVPITSSGTCVTNGTFYGMQARFDLSSFATTPPWQPICGEEVRVDIRVLWPRCARFEGVNCVEHEDVVIGEDSMTVVVQPDPTEDPGHCGL